MRTQRTSLVVASVVLGALVPTAPAETNRLDEALAKQAPAIVQYLRAKNYQNVGVLKFLVQKGKEPATDNIGPLNMNMARRLEVALVLSNPDDKLRIIRNASAAIVDSKRRASHLSPDGRKELFNVPYVLAWGTENDVKADAFLTGTLELSRNLVTTTVRVQALGKDQAEPAEVCKFDVPTDARTLTEAGRSYSLRQLSPAKSDEPARVAQQTEEGKAKHPLDGPDVQWEVYYDNEQIAISIKNGKAGIKGPKQGQVVWFMLRNTGKERCGVVLRVNGENTLYREKLPSSLCRKWVLGPGERVPVLGFQSNERTAGRFKVLSPEESEKEEVNYGEHAGTFSMEVFTAKRETTPVVTGDPKIKAIEAGELPAGKPIKLASLQSKLVEQFRGPAKVSGIARQVSGANTTGLVVGGQSIENLTERVPFDAASAPVLSATLRYYTVGR